jgi:predicted RNA-binding protein with PUA-like domain
MQYWILKSEPGEYSFGDLEREGRTIWDGVRNYQARNNLKRMRKGDQALIYHSVSEKALVGIAEVIRDAYPDPTDNPKGDWVVVDIAPLRPLQRRITLAEIKALPDLRDLPLIRQSRLSVIPLEPAMFERLIALSNTTP